MEEEFNTEISYNSCISSPLGSNQSSDEFFQKNQTNYGVLNNLTNEELEALNQFKKEPIAEGIEDQYLMIFLFAKKLNVAKAAEVLENNLSVRKKLNIPFPVRKRDVNPEIAKKASSFSMISKCDKENRTISYIYPSRIIPKEYPFNEYIAHLLWNVDQTAHYDSSTHRLGLIVVEDLKNISLLKNFDRRFNTLLNGKSMENIFPGRIQKIYLINSPFFARPLLSFAKTFIKSKIINRISIIKKEKLTEFIEPDQLCVDFGGSLTLSYSDYFDSLPSDF
eukprot:gene504-635_t